jgi:hypothetical protein
MEFQETTIIIKNRDLEQKEIPATIGVGTGLAFHLLPVATDAYGDVYTLTHVPSGFGLTEHSVPSIEEARAWLERVAALDKDQWNIDLVTFKHRYLAPSKLHRIRAEIEMAHYDSLHEPAVNW